MCFENATSTKLFKRKISSNEIFSYTQTVIVKEFCLENCCWSFVFILKFISLFQYAIVHCSIFKFILSISCQLLENQRWPTVNDCCLFESKFHWKSFAGNFSLFALFLCFKLFKTFVHVFRFSFNTKRKRKDKKIW